MPKRHGSIWSYSSRNSRYGALARCAIRWRLRLGKVYQEPLTDIGVIKRSADGLVLTEWKKLPEGGSPATCFERARNQAGCYATGVLAGTELTRVGSSQRAGGLDLTSPFPSFSARTPFISVCTS